MKAYWQGTLACDFLTVPLKRYAAVTPEEARFHYLHARGPIGAGRVVDPDRAEGQKQCQPCPTSHWTNPTDAAVTEGRGLSPQGGML